MVGIKLFLKCAVVGYFYERNDRLVQKRSRKSFYIGPNKSVNMHIDQHLVERRRNCSKGILQLNVELEIVFDIFYNIVWHNIKAIIIRRHLLDRYQRFTRRHRCVKGLGLV